jgi:hypothetical protein
MRKLSMDKVQEEHMSRSFIYGCEKGEVRWKRISKNIVLCWRGYGGSRWLPMVAYGQTRSGIWLEMELKWESLVRWDIKKSGDRRWSWVSPDIYPPFKGVTSWHYKRWSSKWDEVENCCSNVMSGSVMSPMEVYYEFRSMDIVPWFPWVVFHSKAFPFD